MLILFLILIVLALVILIANIAIVPQAYSYVVERLGVYYTTWEAGFHFKTPFVTRIAKGLPQGAGRGLQASACDHPR